MSECVRGCTLRGQHKDDCATEACGGCLPRPATHGKLCGSDFSRMWDWLIDIPQLYTELADDELLEPSTGMQTPGKPKKRDASPAPGRVTVMNERDERQVGDDYQGTLGELHYWVRKVRRERGLAGRSGSTVEGDAALLRGHLDHVSQADWVLDCYETLEAAWYRLGNITYSRHPGEKANASCFDCGGDLVRRWRDPEPCECGPKPEWPEIPAYPWQKSRDAVEAWLAVRGRLVGDYDVAVEDWEDGHRACDQGGLTDGYRCRGCGEEYSVGRYWLAVKAQYEAEKAKREAS